MRRITIGFLALAVAVAACFGASMAAGQSMSAGNGLTAAFTVTWDWGSGYEATYTITNNTSTAVSGWVVAFDLPAGQQMGNYWNALEAASGSHYTFTNRDYNGQLAPNGRTASFGFIVIYSGSLVALTNCTVNGSPCAGGGPPASASPAASPAASPTASPPPTITVHQATQPPGGGGGGGNRLPAHILTGYWQDFTNGATPLTLAQVPSAYNVVVVAFGTATGTPGQVAFSLDPGLSSALGGYSAAQFTSDIKTMHGRGQNVILSVGGQNGAIAVNDAASASSFAASVHALMQQYGFDGVDIDLENGLNPTYMAAALKQLSSMAGSSLIITLTPQTTDVQSVGGAYFQLALNIKNILTIMNTQYYNSGTMNGCDGNVYAEGTENFLTALACIQLKGSLNPSQVGLGLPASQSAAGSGYVNPSVVNSALDCLASGRNCGSFTPPSAWSGIGGAMTWSINWDASNGYSFANTVGPHLGTLP